MPNIGPLEIAIVLVIVLIIFGPKRLPELGKSMGKGIRDFRGAMSGEHDEEDPTPAQPPAKPAEIEPTKAAATPTEQGEVVTEHKA